jgi:prepilin peptidase CpaA
MDSIAWWPSFAVLVLASAIDICTRRVPNWLVLPFLVLGFVVRIWTGGLTGAKLSFAGAGLACLLFGLPCLLRGMGMGDLKLAVAVGAWIGPGQLFIAFVVTGIAGAAIAIPYALWNKSLGRCLDNTSDLLAHFGRRGVRPHGEIRLGKTDALAIPYAPAIAVGTLFSFFAR